MKYLFMFLLAIFIWRYNNELGSEREILRDKILFNKYRKVNVK
jgi:hypothetical protein